MEVQQAILTKRAVRQFDPRPLPEAVVQAILNAGRRSQSSKNSQPWHFIAIGDRQRLLELSTLGEWAGHLAGAALGVAILTPNPTERFQTMFDAGQSAAYMQLAAWELGVGSCLASIYQPEAARSLLGFPDSWHLRIAVSFGYPADPELIDQPPRKPGRRPLEDIVHWETW